MIHRDGRDIDVSKPGLADAHKPNRRERGRCGDTDVRPKRLCGGDAEYPVREGGSRDSKAISAQQ